MILFFDTETTGKAEFRLPPDHPSQPGLVQLACALYTGEGREVACFASIVKPHKAIDPGAVRVHGITQELADEFGIPELSALKIFRSFLTKAYAIAAHNIKFDLILLLGRAGRGRTDGLHDLEAMIMDRTIEDTMQTATDILKLPGRYGSYKWPKLEECVKFFFNESIEGAHDALVDVRACARIYFHMKKMENVE